MRTLKRTPCGNTNIIICECEHYYAYTNVIMQVQTLLCNYEHFNAPPMSMQMQKHPLCKCKRTPYANANVIMHLLFIQIYKCERLLLLRICECERIPYLSHIFVEKMIFLEDHEFLTKMSSGFNKFQKLICFGNL